MLRGADTQQSKFNLTPQIHMYPSVSPQIPKLCGYITQCRTMHTWPSAYMHSQTDRKHIYLLKEKKSAFKWAHCSNVNCNLSVT